MYNKILTAILPALLLSTPSFAYDSDDPGGSEWDLSWEPGSGRSYEKSDDGDFPEGVYSGGYGAGNFRQWEPSDDGDFPEGFYGNTRRSTYRSTGSVKYRRQYRSTPTMKYHRQSNSSTYNSRRRYSNSSVRSSSVVVNQANGSTTRVITSRSNGCYGTVCKGAKVVVTLESVQVRNGLNVVGVIYNGAEVEIKEVVNNWGRVEINDEASGSMKIGFVDLRLFQQSQK